MANSAAILAEAARLQGTFQAAGAMTIQTDVLQPAETLLDLYGEDIRARAFVTHDALRGEYMLRPDFTVPVVQMHMDGGAEPARYTYSGKVFRQQDGDMSRPQEYHQVGYEVFDRANPMAADAEVFALISNAMADVPVHAVTGDIGILKAAVLGLATSDRRKSALLRHIWRPKRFRALLDRYGGVSPVPQSRAALLSDPDPLAGLDEFQGLRSRQEICDRIEILRADAADTAIGAVELDLLAALLDLKNAAPVALAKLWDLCKEMPALERPASDMATRLDALDGRGIDVSNLAFDASYGRSSMEYYDGFVFGFYRDDRPDLPPVATGGRYDALTKILGRGNSIPAVGGVIRPALVLEDGA